MPSHDRTDSEQELIDNLREINRDLRRSADHPDAPEPASENLHAARQKVIEAIRIIDPPSKGDAIPLDELDVADYLRKVGGHAATHIAPSFERARNRIQTPDQN